MHLPGLLLAEPSAASVDGRVADGTLQSVTVLRHQHRRWYSACGLVNNKANWKPTKPMAEMRPPQVYRQPRRIASDGRSGSDDVPMYSTIHWSARYKTDAVRTHVHTAFVDRTCGLVPYAHICSVGICRLV